MDKNMNSKEISLLKGSFYWCFGYDYFISTERGNFIWKDPQFGGDNSFISFNGNIEEYKREKKISSFRWEGVLLIAKRCGNFNMGNDK